MSALSKLGAAIGGSAFSTGLTSPNPEVRLIALTPDEPPEFLGKSKAYADAITAAESGLTDWVNGGLRTAAHKAMKENLDVKVVLLCVAEKRPKRNCPGEYSSTFRLLMIVTHDENDHDVLIEDTGNYEDVTNTVWAGYRSTNGGKCNLMQTVTLDDLFAEKAVALPSASIEEVDELLEDMAFTPSTKHE